MEDNQNGVVSQEVKAEVEGDSEVNVEEVEMVSGAPRGEIVRQLLTALAKKDIAGALAAIRTTVEENMDARTLVKLLIHRLRVVLLLRSAPELAKQLSHELTEADLALAQELSKEAGVNSHTLRTLLEAYSQTAYAAVPHLPLELALIDICAS